MIYIFTKINSRISSISATASSFTLKHAPECSVNKKFYYMYNMHICNLGEQRGVPLPEYWEYNDCNK